jgi:hypothetical protein
MTIKASLLAAAGLAIGMAMPASAQQTLHTLSAPRVYVQTSSQRTSHTGGFMSQMAVMRSVVIPPETGGLLAATFSAEARCISPDPKVVVYCSVQIWCDGIELFPKDIGNDFSFNSSTGGISSVSIIRHSGFVGPGNHECFVGATAAQGATHELDDWTFTVRFWRMES